jgi:hypothetical protein
MSIASHACRLVGCGSGGDDTADPSTVFDAAVFEIDYEQGQEPFTGLISALGDTFDVMTANMTRVFAGKKTLVIPRTVDAEYRCRGRRGIDDG